MMMFNFFIILNFPFILNLFLFQSYDCVRSPIKDQSSGKEIDLNQASTPPSSPTEQYQTAPLGVQAKQQPSSSKLKYDINWSIGMKPHQMAHEIAKSSGKSKKSKEYSLIFGKHYQRLRRQMQQHLASKGDQKSKELLENHRKNAVLNSKKYFRGIYERKRNNKPTLKDLEIIRKQAIYSKNHYDKHYKGKPRKMGGKKSSVTEDLPKE